MLLGSIMKLFPLPFRGTRKYLLYRTLFLLKRNRGTFRTGRQENIQSLVKTEVLQVSSVNVVQNGVSAVLIAVLSKCLDRF